MAACWDSQIQQPVVPPLSPQKPFRMFDVEFGSGTHSLGFEPDQKGSVLFLCTFGYAFQAAGESLGIRFPCPGYRPLPFVVFVVTWIPARIDPRLVEQSDETVELWDNCFSFPGLMVRVSRAASVTVEYTDRDGVPQKINAEGALSELLQHEIDHLNGILATDRAVSERAIMTRPEWEKAGSPA